MKSDNTLKIQFESWEGFKARIKGKLKTKKKSIISKNTLVFSSVTEYQRFMTEQKLAILAAIINFEPSSIYELAQILERDFANVQRDCVGLEGMGFIKMNENKNSKKSKLPRLSFNYTKILVEMPKLSYSHNLLDAA